MSDVARLLQAFLAPAIFVSAAALLVLSINARLMGIVGRLRQFHREQREAAEAGRAQEADVLATQIISVERRAEQIRKAFLLTLASLAGTLFTCLLLGLGLYWPIAQILAIALFVATILAMLFAVVFYAAEVLVALSSVRDEARFYGAVKPPSRDRRSEPRPGDYHDGM